STDDFPVLAASRSASRALSTSSSRPFLGGTMVTNPLDVSILALTGSTLAAAAAWSRTADTVPELHFGVTATEFEEWPKARRQTRWNRLPLWEWPRAPLTAVGTSTCRPRSQAVVSV